MGGDPASCCKAIQETRRVDLSMEGGPEDMTIYGLTKENRMDDQIRRFFQCVREELQMIDGIELFSGR